jgi:hypothetical protein
LVHQAVRQTKAKAFLDTTKEVVDGESSSEIGLGDALYTNRVLAALCGVGEQVGSFHEDERRDAGPRVGR